MVRAQGVVCEEGHQKQCSVSEGVGDIPVRFQLLLNLVATPAAIGDQLVPDIGFQRPTRRMLIPVNANVQPARSRNATGNSAPSLSTTIKQDAQGHESGAGYSKQKNRLNDCDPVPRNVVRRISRIDLFPLHLPNKDRFLAQNGMASWKALPYKYISKLPRSILW